MYRYFITLDIVDNTGGMVNPFQENFEIVASSEGEAKAMSIDEFKAVDANKKDSISITNVRVKTFFIQPGMTLLYKAKN